MQTDGRVIIVEGPDGAGKTTLARYLVAQFDFEYIHMSRPPEGVAPFDYWWPRIRNLLKTKSGLVIDRLHLSEDVYGTLFRGGSRLSDLDRWILEGWLTAHGGMIIKCLPPLEVVLNNAAELPDGMYHNRATDVWTAFNTWNLNSALPVYRFDYTSDKEPDRIVCTAPGLPLVYPGIGNPDARIVLVGDRHNRCNVKKRICEDPIVFRSASGEYLRWALGLAGLTPYDYYIINGWHDDGAPTPLSYRFAGARYVALGREGARALREHGIEPHADVGHPQYWKRFKYREIATYAREIREATRC